MSTFAGPPFRDGFFRATGALWQSVSHRTRTQLEHTCRQRATGADGSPLGRAVGAPHTRRMSLTHEGEIYLAHARRILADIDDMERELSHAQLSPKGLLRVNATLGFGRSHVAPLISQFAKRFRTCKCSCN